MEHFLSKLTEATFIAVLFTYCIIIAMVVIRVILAAGSYLFKGMSGNSRMKPPPPVPHKGVIK